MEELIDKYLLGKMSKEEKETFFEMLNNNPELKQQVAEIQNTSALISMRYASKGNAFVLASHKRTKQHKLIAVNLIKYAAIAIVSIFISYLFFINNTKSISDNLFVEVSAPSGQRAKVMLEDGSAVWLNANSTLRYNKNFGEENREVALVGEAFFDVAKNKDKEFVVKTSKVDIIVTGTKFNVSAYPADQECLTSLVEGEVKVACGNHKKEIFILNPNEQLSIVGPKITKTRFIDTNFMSWTEGIFIFKNRTLDDIVKKLEFYYDVSITIENEKLKSLRYTGKFRQRDGVENVLKKLQIIYPFIYERNDDFNQITIR